VLASTDKHRIRSAIFEHLGEILPGVREIEKLAVNPQVEGGWVFALGRGALSDRDATLHRRNRIGVTRRGSYVSVNTGKYSIAPWLARKIAADIAA